MVQAQLPLHCLLSFRTVCKQWNMMLQSKSFIAKVPCARHGGWFLFRGEGKECVAFMPSVNKWCQINLDFLLPARVRVVATSGGLLCVRQHDDQLIVCNPFTKAWLQLPPKLHRWKYPIVGMVKIGQSYNVVVAGRKGAHANIVTEIYDSETATWKLVIDKNQIQLQQSFQTNAVFFNGSLYCAGQNAILVYNMEQNQWMEISRPIMENTKLMLPQICVCHSCLLMVEVMSSRFLMTRISIWKLPKFDGLWSKIASMPDKLLKEVMNISGSRLFTYFGCNNLVLFIFARRRVLAYNIRQNSWHWIPCCPFIHNFARRFAHFSYDPNLGSTI
ncbi:unnamed protein product [Sphagnum balticum]